VAVEMVRTGMSSQ